MSKIKAPAARPSPNDQSNLDNLAAMGIQVNPDGSVQALDDAFQGTSTLGTPDPGYTGSQPTVSSTQDVHTYDRLEDDGVEEPETGETQGEVDPTPAPKKHGDGEQTPEGLAKREADARKAQQAMSKAQIKLDQTLEAVNKRMVDLDDQIRKLEVIQVTAGTVPPELNPADSETVEQFRSDYPVETSVFEAMVAPVYAIIGQIREKLNAVVQQQGEYFSKVKESEVFAGVYAKIPESKVKQITDSPEFIEWLSSKPASKRNLYVNILNETSRYSPEEAIEVFSDFARDTGTDLGLNGKPHTPTPPAMDSAPRLRSGGALPEVPAPERRPESSELTPLSMQELASFGHNIQNLPPAEAAVLRKRFDLTQLNFNGNEARTLR